MPLAASGVSFESSGVARPCMVWYRLRYHMGGSSRTGESGTDSSWRISIGPAEQVNSSAKKATSRKARSHGEQARLDRKSTRLNSSHQIISYAVFCLKKKKKLRDTRESSQVPKC